MSFGMKVLLKAAVRIEKKVDELLKMVTLIAQQQTGTPIPPMPQPLNVPAQGVCPLCQNQVMYMNTPSSPEEGLVLQRVCGCEPASVDLNLTGDVR
jgi:hypothetical protein